MSQTSTRSRRTFFLRATRVELPGLPQGRQHLGTLMPRTEVREVRLDLPLRECQLSLCRTLHGHVG